VSVQYVTDLKEEETTLAKEEIMEDQTHGVKYVRRRIIKK